MAHKLRGYTKEAQMLMLESFEKTKRFFQKTLRCIKSLPGGCPTLLPIFSTGNQISSKFQQLQDFCKSLSGRRQSSEVKKEGQAAPKEQKGGDEGSKQNSMCVPEHSKLKGLKEGKKARKHPGEKQNKFSNLSEHKLAQKMKELEMVDMNDGDHVLDIEEVLHYYSLLTSPVYLEIVDKFFMDMYYEFHLPQPTRNTSTSMRKLGCGGSVHSSMRKLGCGGSVHSSMRNVDLPGSMRNVDFPGSMRKMGAPSVIHGSMRKSDSGSVDSSMRKMGSASAHSSMRSLGPLKL